MKGATAVARSRPMLRAFLRDHRGQIILRVRERVARRRAPLATDDELEIGVPLFLDQLGAALDRTVTGVAEISAAATQQGNALLQSGFTVSQVVHGYGDICQVVTGLAIELDAPMSNDEFRTLNLCLDEAIAGAVTEFTRLREESIAGQGTERLGFLAHEIRNLLGGALMAFHMLRDGTVPIAGSTGAILGRSLSRSAAAACARWAARSRFETSPGRGASSPSGCSSCLDAVG